MRLTPETPLFYEYLPAGAATGPEATRVLLHPSRPAWIIGNGTFAEIASLLGEGKSADEAARIMAVRFGMDSESMVRDARYVADQLTRYGFLGEGREAPVRVPRLTSLFVYVTGRCNLTCSHCYLPSSFHGDIPQDLFRKMVDEAVEAGAAAITLTGGEPILHPRLKELIAHGARNCAVTLLTNGTLIDEGWASFLADAGEVNVQVSIDGSRKEIHDAVRGEGSFEKALRAIGYLQNAGLGTRITFAATAMASNFNDLPAIMDLAKTLGVGTVRFLPVRRKGRADLTWDSTGSAVDEKGYTAFFDRVLSEWNGATPSLDVSCGLSGFVIPPPGEARSDDAWCPVGGRLVITPHGDAYPCVLMQTDEFSLGNVFREGLARVMASPALARACRALGERKDRIDECAGCRWRNFCQGGCMGEALDEKGTVWERGRFCTFRRGLYEKAFQNLLNGRGGSP